MRERDYNLQTPQKDQSVAIRRSKSVSDHRKKPQKISRKNLNSELSALSDDVSLFDFTSISENGEENLLPESAEKFTAALSPVTSLGLKAVDSPDLTQLSSVTTSDEHKEVTNLPRAVKSETGKLSSIEAGLVVKHLREAQLQIFNARDVNFSSKRILDALVDIVVEEFIQMPEEKDWFNELKVRKQNLLFLSFLLWILLVSAVYFYFSGRRSSFTGVIPT